MTKKILYGMIAILLTCESVWLYKKHKDFDIISFGCACMAVGLVIGAPKEDNQKTERHDTE